MRGGWFVMVILALALVLGQAGPLLAADEHAEGGGDGDIFGWALDLGIWTIVVFVVLLFVLTRYAWKPMLEGLQQREHNIHEELSQAERKHKDAQQLRDEFKRQMDQVQEQVREIIEQARKDGQRVADDMINRTRAEIQSERERLHREIETARDQALQQLWTQTAQLATLVSAKTIRRQLNQDDHRRLVDEALAELKQAGGDRQRQVASQLS